MLLKETNEETSFVIEKEFTALPLAHKGFNKHFIDLVTADVYIPRKINFIQIIKDIFS